MTTTGMNPPGVRPRTAALVATLGLAAACWVLALWWMPGVGTGTGGTGMDGMPAGVATRLDPFPVFLTGWTVMMAAMMLPGAAPAVVRRVEATGRLRAVPAFLGGYLALWTLVGVAVYACYRPHGTTVAGVLAIAAGRSSRWAC